MYLKIALSILSYDIWFYISHLLLHTPTLWFIHKEHHLAEEPMFLDTYKAHIIESPFQGGGMFIPYVFYTYSIYETLIILVLLNTRGMMAHDRRFSFLVGNHHLLHHKYHNCNYGQFYLDYLFGTNRNNVVSDGEVKRDR